MFSPNNAIFYINSIHKASFYIQVGIYKIQFKCTLFSLYRQAYVCIVILTKYT